MIPCRIQFELVNPNRDHYRIYFNDELLIERNNVYKVLETIHINACSTTNRLIIHEISDEPQIELNNIRIESDENIQLSHSVVTTLR